MSEYGNVNEATDESHTDQGVPVGTADVEADIERAGGDTDRLRDSDRDDYLEEGAAEGSTDQGVPVGSADVEADRRRAAGED